MKQLLEFCTAFNWLALPQTIVETLLYADWQGAHKRHGGVGMAGELLNSLVGTNTFPFFVPSSCPWGAGDIQGLLGRHGIKMWGAGWANGELFFRVPKRQAVWAQYVMQRAGVPLLHRLLTAQPAAGGSSELVPAAPAGAHQSGSALTGIERCLDQLAALL